MTRGRWRIFDITPRHLGLPGALLDFPDLAVGANMLYFTVNASINRVWTASVLLRIPLAGLTSGQITPQRTISRDNFSFRVAQNCGTRAFWASHENTSTLRVFSWNEQAAQPSFHDVTVANWAGPPFTSTTPDGFNWLGRAE